MNCTKYARCKYKAWRQCCDDSQNKILSSVHVMEL